MIHFKGVSKINDEKNLLISLIVSVCLSVRMEQFDSHLTDFRGILYWCFPLKSDE